MRFTLGVIVGLAIQGGLSQTSVPSEGELTLRQDTGVPDTEAPPTDVVQPPVVSDTPPVQTNPVESPAADPTPTDVAPPQVTASEAPGSNSEPAGDASSVGTVPLETPLQTIPATAPEQTPAQTQTGGELTQETPVGTGTQAPPPPQPTPSEGPVTASAQGGESTVAATGAADNTEAADDTAVASETRAPGQTPTRGEEPTSVVNSAVQSAVPSAISSAIESAITSAIRSAEQASTFAEEVSTVAGIVTTIGDVETTIEGVRTITNKAPASDGSSGGTTLTTRPAATSTVSVPVSLQSASVGDNAVVKQVDGKPAVVLSPPAGGQASFEVTAAKPQAVKEKDLVRVKANVTLTESTGGTGQAKDDPCNVNMNVNGKSVYNKDLSAGTTNGPFEITSDFFEAASGDQDIKMTQKCGQNPQQMTVNGMSLQGQVRAESGSGNGGSGGSGGSETSSADGSQSTGKDNASSSNKPAMFALGLVAALAVFVM